jgi:hypothetical protein
MIRNSREFLTVAETDDIDRGDLQDNLQRIAFLPMTDSPKLKPAVAALREALNCHKLVKSYGWAYSNFVDKLFKEELEVTAEHNRRNGDDLPLNVPIIGGTCEPEEIPRTKYLICRALAAIVRFEDEKPNWAPELPVRGEDIKQWQRGRMQLIGHFANSWYRRGWGPHPSFADYYDGVSALPHMADFVRSTDPARFHPRLLAGLDPQTLCWEPPVKTGLPRHTL